MYVCMYICMCVCTSGVLEKQLRVGAAQTLELQLASLQSMWALQAEPMAPCRDVGF
jgi:bacterioferritin-associated ferredoxin